MKKLQLVLSLLSLCTLTACYNTMEGAKKDGTDINNWAHNKPSTFGQAVGDAPTGYHLQPPSSAAEYAAATQNGTMPSMRGDEYSGDGKRMWHTIDNYDAQNPALPSGGMTQQEDNIYPLPLHNSSEEPVQYGRSVDVYPLGGETAPSRAGYTSSVVTPRGEKVQQVFFSHGSARIGRNDSNGLRRLAKSLAHNNGDYQVSVVGHASNRVNGVTDPVEKKMINFKMAQKRAGAVAGVLRKSGVSPAWIMATSQGDEQPNMDRGGRTQEAADRRAEVFLVTN